MGQVGKNEIPFQPAVQEWLAETFAAPTPPQAQAWPAIMRGDDVLVAAPTGSGKTLCAFLSAIDLLVRESQSTELPAETRVLYISPLKALSNDIERNLQAPLLGVAAKIAAHGSKACSITTAVRTGDTSASERAKQTKHPAHLFVTTPESLYVLLTSEGGRRMLSTVRTVIVDEVHAMVRDKRGAHLSLSLERLDQLLIDSGGARAQRIGLSATQKPVDRVAAFLTGCSPETASPRPCTIVDTGHHRPLDLNISLPGSPLEAVMSAECWGEIYDQLAELIKEHTTTLIFTNTRRMAERITRFLAERLGEDAVTSHHGSLSRPRRWAAEQALKSGKLRALVATASLELGIDVGEVDLVCQMGSTGSIATLLQRVGRSGHFVGGTPKGRIFPLTRDELVESIALLQAVKNGELDSVSMPESPLDILAQQMVAAVVPQVMGENELYSLVRRATPYRHLERAQFDRVLAMLAEGFSTARGRRGAYLHHDAIGSRIKARRSARLTALTNGGAIPDNFDFEVLLQPSNTRIGTVHEDFAVESMPGDVFQLGNTSYQILKVEPGIVRVADAAGQPPSIPFWVGEAPSRSDELSYSVSRFRKQVAALPHHGALEMGTTRLVEELTLSQSAAEQALSYLLATRASLGHLPTQELLVAERFFDEAGGMHVVLHSPYGSRINRAFGLALRKRFCRSFNVELQAAAGEDALILSLGPMHSFPLESLFEFLRAATVKKVLTQALLDAPLFQTRWRWNASRSLAVLRFRGGKKVPPRFQRIDSDDLLALCFPDQVACLENIAGDRDIPNHPLVEQTIRDSLTEAMDVIGLESLLANIESGTVKCIARDLTEPSPLAHEIINARPYAFLDDAPLEERRTQAVQMRRFADPSTSDDLGRLNPAAIIQVLEEASIAPRDADELHDALLVHSFLPTRECPWLGLLDELASAGRVFRADTSHASFWFATERASWALSVHGDAQFFPKRPSITVPLPSRDDALQELVRGRLEHIGPTTAEELALVLGVPVAETKASLLTLETEGFVLRGSFRPEHGEEFCERRLLSRIHRLTLSRLRREIEPVSPSQFLDFLVQHQGLLSDTLRAGSGGTRAVLEQLSGFPVAAGSWESQILPPRLRGYNPRDLDELCLSGQLTWRAQRKSSKANGTQGPIRSTPILIIPREEAHLWTPKKAPPNLRADARNLATLLKQSGALFFEDIRRQSGLLPSQAEAALSELVGAGLVNTDSFAGLRALLIPESKRGNTRRGPRRSRYPMPTSLASVGRMSWLGGDEELNLENHDGSLESLRAEENQLEIVAWTLLTRWGVVFRKLLEREQSVFAWGHLLKVYHRLEARGEIRGGRFVSGFSGEQFATPEALSLLRQVRRQGPSQQLVRISATDPLNLRGILTPDPRLPATSKNQLLIRGGQIVAIEEAGHVTALPPQTPENGTTPDLSTQEIASALRGPIMAVPPTGA